MNRFLATPLARALVAAGVLGLSLAGCGGGGSSSPAPVGNVDVTSANQDTVARGSLVALQAGVLGGSAGVAGGGSALARAAFAPRKHIAAVQPPVDDACFVSGSTRTVLDDRDNSGGTTPTVGDVATITYTDCVEVAGEVTNGTITATFTQIQTAALPATIAATITTTDLRTQTAHGSVAAQGGFTMTLRIDSLSADSLRVTVPSGFTLAITTPLYSDTITLKPGYVLDSSYDGTALPPGGSIPGRTTTTANGPVESATAAGYVQLATLQALVQYDIDAYPRSGQFQAAGKTGTLRGTVLSATQVQIDLDADGNGVYEASKIVPWTDFF